MEDPRLTRCGHEHRAQRRHEVRRGFEPPRRILRQRLPEDGVELLWKALADLGDRRNRRMHVCRCLRGDRVVFERTPPAQELERHDRRYLLDSSKLRSELTWAPEIDFERGLSETVAWYAEHRDWWEPLKERAPVEETAWR